MRQTDFRIRNSIYVSESNLISIEEGHEQEPKENQNKKKKKKKRSKGSHSMLHYLNDDVRFQTTIYLWLLFCFSEKTVATNTLSS